MNARHLLRRLISPAPRPIVCFMLTDRPAFARRAVGTRHRYVALCPYHEERSPSLVISANLETFHCFGCGMAGRAVRDDELLARIKAQSEANKLIERAKAAP